MAEQTIGEIIQNQIENSLNQFPTPMRCKITKVYDDQKHVDINCDLGDMEYVEVIANNPTVNNLGVIIFLNGSNEDFIVITK